MNAQTHVEPATVQAPLHYLANLDITPVSHNPPPGEGGPYRDGNYQDYTVAISDARAAAHDFSLDREGFELVRHETEVRDFYDDDEVRAVYDLEVEHLLKQATGASRVVVFDHTRRATGGSDEGGSADRAPVRLVHNDYTETSGPQRVRDLLGDGEADELLKHRFADMKLWLEASHATADGAALAVAIDVDAARTVSVAKAYIGDKSVDIIQDCVQLHGGIGVTWEHDIHLYLRRATVNRGLFGTPNDHRERLAALVGIKRKDETT